MQKHEIPCPPNVLCFQIVYQYIAECLAHTARVNEIIAKTQCFSEGGLDKRYTK